MKSTAISLTLFFLCATTGLAENWPRFRGPNGAGISDCQTIPTKWSTSNHKWKVPLGGTGHGAPVVWGERLFVTSANKTGTERHLLCLNTKTGKTIWKETFPFEKIKTHKNNSYASTTPAVDADHVYVLWQSRLESPLVAFDHSGKEVWRYYLGPYYHGQGPATSPIVFGDYVFICNDQKSNSFLLCVNRKTGKEVWKTSRRGERACYATPCVFQPAGQSPEIVFSHCFEGIVGVNPETGKQNWHIHVFGSHSQRAVGSPVVWNDMVFANSGARAGEKNAVAIQISGSDEKRMAKETYRLTKTTAPHVPSLLVYKNWLFLWSDSGILTCADVKTGKKIWQKRVGGNFFGSPVCVNGRLYCISVDGNVIVVEAGDKFRLLGRNALGESSHSTPAVGDGKMFLRTTQHLIAVGG